MVLVEVGKATVPVISTDLLLAGIKVWTIHPESENFRNDVSQGIKMSEARGFALLCKKVQHDFPAAEWRANPPVSWPFEAG